MGYQTNISDGTRGEDQVHLPELVWRGDWIEVGAPVVLQSQTNIQSLAYYHELRHAAGDRAPSWRQFKPQRMVPYLTLLYLLELDQRRLNDPAGHYYRMFGTDFAQGFGSDLYHRTLADMEPGIRRDRSLTINKVGATLAEPAVIRGQVKGVLGDVVWSECLIMPLASEASDRSLLFGTASFDIGRPDDA